MMRKLRSTTFLLSVIIIIPLISVGFVHWVENRYDTLPKLNKTDFFTPYYTFTNQDNKTRTFNNWGNKILVVNYFFTTCPTICPKMINNLKTVAGQFNNDPGISLLSFTVDPQHDTAAKLLRYTRNMEAIYPNWEFLTGDKKVLYNLARKQFYITATDGDGGPQDFIHSDKLVLVDKQETIRGYYDGTSQEAVQKLISDIKKLKNEN